MTPERWRQITEVFNGALACDADARAAYLDRACAEDRDLRAEVDSLLNAHVKAGTLGQPGVRGEAPTSTRVSVDTASPIVDTSEPDAEVAKPSRRRLFTVFVWIATPVILAIFIYATWFLLKPGVNLGWTEERKPGAGWFVATVDPNGPAAGQLKQGDRIVNMNGAVPLPGRGTGPARQAMAPGSMYPITVERDRERVDYALAARPGRNAGGREFAYLGVSFVWCAVGLFIGLACAYKPEARLACVSAVLTGLVFLPVNLRPWTFFNPLHVVVGLHFFARFPDSPPLKGLRRWVLGALYAIGSLPPLIAISRRVLILAGRPQAHPFGPLELLPVQSAIALYTFYVAIAAIVVVAWRKYHALADEDQRRRVRWVALGAVVALLPEIVLSAAELLHLNGLAQATAVPADVASAGVPLSVAYAVVKHRVFDIRVVVRRGVQYLLAKSALQILLIVPVIALTYTVIVNRHLTVVELLTQSKGYLFWIAAAALSLRFRRPIRLWLDRKFFREEYDREQALLGVVGDLGKAESIPDLSELMSATLEATLHPQTLYIWYRDPGELTAVATSNPMRTPLDFPSGRRWLSWIEARGAAAELPLPMDAGLSAAEARWFSTKGIRLVVPITDSGERLAGVLLLGPKKSDAAYAPSDRRLLQAIATQAGVVRENLRLRAQVTEDRRIRRDVLARLDGQRLNLLKECPRCGACFDAQVERCDGDGEMLTLSLPISRLVDGKYRLDRLIGQGGMGAVYEAHDLRLERTVAIKVLVGRAFGGRAALRRFHREARAAAKLNHPRIVNVYDYGPIEGEGAYIVMERVRGATLRVELANSGALPRARAADWFDQILDGLSAAHAQGIVHRDLKPENIMGFSPAPNRLDVKILDFGLAKLRADQSMASDTLTIEGVVMGTLGYMAPEQVAGAEVDYRADLFACGVMLAEALTGTRPFQGATYESLMRAVLSETYHLPGASSHDRAIDELLQGCLAKNPEHRLSSARDLRTALIPLLRAANESRASGL